MFSFKYENPLYFNTVKHVTIVVNNNLKGGAQEPNFLAEGGVRELQKGGGGCGFYGIVYSKLFSNKFSGAWRPTELQYTLFLALNLTIKGKQSKRNSSIFKQTLKLL